MLSFSAYSSPDEDALDFDDFPLMDTITYPAWFKESFLDLEEDLQESLDKGKKGLIVYFGQKRCPYCKMLLDVNFGQDEIQLGRPGHQVTQDLRGRPGRLCPSCTPSMDRPPLGARSSRPRDG